MQDSIDTSIWAPEVQAYTRMFYARYGASPPGQTPWRLGRGLQPADGIDTPCSHRPDSKRSSVRGTPSSEPAEPHVDVTSGTFLTAAHLDAIQHKVPHTSLPLWQQYSSAPIEAIGLQSVRAWATAMRPRSIHDLKPMLMLCQVWGALVHRQHRCIL